MLSCWILGLVSVVQVSVALLAAKSILTQSVLAIRPELLSVLTASTISVFVLSADCLCYFENSKCLIFSQFDSVEHIYWRGFCRPEPPSLEVASENLFF